MNVLLVEPDYYTRYPPLGLLKLSSWHKSKGDNVRYVRGCFPISTYRPDLILVTSLFTWSWNSVADVIRYYKALFPQAELHLGGVYASLMHQHASSLGADYVHQGTLPLVDDIVPDYSLVPDWTSSIVFSSRGCVRKCAFCAVPRLEGDPTQSTSIRSLIHPEHRKVVLWDNNILGTPGWEDLIEELKEINLPVDFNQGLDGRFIKNGVAEKLRGLRIPLIRMAYDWPQIRRAIGNAIESLAEVGFRRKSIVAYVLYNYTDTPEDLLSRVRDLLEWGAVAYPMRYQPLDALTKNEYVADAWSPDELEMVDRARRVIGVGGAFPAYEGLVRKFREARDFREAFELRSIDWRAGREEWSDRRDRLGFREMGDDHEWPIAN